jgi:hypothetical protein
LLTGDTSLDALQWAKGRAIARVDIVKTAASAEPALELVLTRLSCFPAIDRPVSESGIFNCYKNCAPFARWGAREG